MWGLKGIPFGRYLKSQPGPFLLPGCLMLPANVQSRHCKATRGIDDSASGEDLAALLTAKESTRPRGERREFGREGVDRQQAGGSVEKAEASPMRRMRRGRSNEGSGSEADVAARRVAIWMAQWRGGNGSGLEAGASQMR